jgi:Gram-negative bacterial TonB protein C-terminal
MPKDLTIELADCWHGSKKLKILQEVGLISVLLCSGASQILQAQTSLPQATKAQSSTEVSIVTTWEDDSYPYWQATITDASQVSEAVQVNYFYVESAVPPCNQPEIKATSKLLPSTKVDALTAPLNLCALDTEAINSSARRYTRPPKPFETVRVGIIVLCGTTRKVFQLPLFEMNETSLQQESPEVSRLMELERQVLMATFGKNDLRKLISQENGGQKRQDLQTDKFREGFWFCRRGTNPASQTRVGSPTNPIAPEECDWSKLQLLLAAYKYPPTKASDRKGQIINPRGYRFVKYVAAEYPSIFVLRHVEGTVELELAINQDGYVEGTKIISGPQYLSKLAEDAAKQWQFDSNQIIRNPVKISIKFSPECNN